MLFDNDKSHHPQAHLPDRPQPLHRHPPFTAAFGIVLIEVLHNVR
jgi:hypothetical protein